MRKSPHSPPIPTPRYAHAAQPGAAPAPASYLCKKIESPISTIEPISTISHKKIAVAGTQRLPLPLRRSGDDAQRRTFPPPRQAVAAVRSPVFRRPGVGDMRGAPSPSPIATPEAVAGSPHSIARSTTSQGRTVGTHSA